MIFLFLIWPYFKGQIIDNSYPAWIYEWNFIKKLLKNIVSAWNFIKKLLKNIVSAWNFIQKLLKNIVCANYGRYSWCTISPIFYK
jgi:hypothetical protein